MDPLGSIDSSVLSGDDQNIKNMAAFSTNRENLADEESKESIMASCNGTVSHINDNTTTNTETQKSTVLQIEEHLPHALLDADEPSTFLALPRELCQDILFQSLKGNTKKVYGT